ncbi:MAG: hypothetical protein JJ971_04400 [Balneolaceae bacterium]|nr:hypothetical protein [Balneolaceae bacterium]MBO6545615.1 hypothetical protein [Balneolaceae bacterium]MBO6647011.1 hypothetical protein [Balneolaceae bacterium]
MKYIIPFLLVTLFLVCSFCEPDSSTPDLIQQIVFDHGVKIETTFENGHSRDSYEYYNDNDKLIESVGYEYRSQLKYDSLGVLKEVFHCRMYNCEIGIRELFIYDNSGNNIGSYATTDSLVNIDTVSFTQTKYYNALNQLVREMTNSGTDVYGEDFEYWSHYNYENDLIKIEFQTRNRDTIWTGSYSYNSRELLEKIEYWNEENYRFITHRYNENEKLVSKTLESGPEELAENVAFHVNSNKYEFAYDSLGRKSEAKLFNHKDELQWSKKYTYFKQ